VILLPKNFENHDLSRYEAGLASDGWAAIFFYLTNIIFLEKLAWEILEKIRKKYRPKIIMLAILCCPKLPRTSFEN
jgi:hypothetical protein